MGFDYTKFLVENGLTLGSSLRREYSEEEQSQEQPKPEVDPAKKAKLDKYTAQKNQILAQYKAGKLSLDQYRAKVNNIPQQIQKLRADMDAELHPDVAEEEPTEDNQQQDSTGEEKNSQQSDDDAWDNLEENKKQLNKESMSFDYRKFLEENKLTIASKGKDKFLKEDVGMNIVGATPNIDYTDGPGHKLSKSDDEAYKHWKAIQDLAELTGIKDDLLDQYKSGEISIEEYKEKIGDIPQQIKNLQKIIQSSMDVTSYKRPNKVQI